MSYQVSQGDLLGRIGTGLGKGISESLPQEIERYRLSQGLKDIATSGNQEPLQIMSKLLSTPGVTEQKAQMLMPYIQQYMQRQEANQRVQRGQMGQPGQVSPEIVPRETQPKTISTQGKGSIVTPESTLAAQEVWREPSYEERLAKATELSNNNRATYPTPQDALAEVNNQINIEKQNLQARKQGFKDQTDLQTAADEQFNKHMSEKLQADVARDFSEVWGDLRQDLRNKMYEEIATGVPVAEAGAKYGKEALDIAKTMNSLKAKGSIFRYITPGAQASTRKALKGEFRDTFKKLGRLDDYSKILQGNLGLSPVYGDDIAFPVSDNPEIAKLIKENKESRALETVRPPTSGKKLRDLTDQIMKNWTPGDSLLSIGLALKQANYDENAFYDRVRSNYKNKLTPIQDLQLKNSGPIVPTIGDAWLNEFILGGRA